MTASRKAFFCAGRGAPSDDAGAVMVEFLIAYLPVLIAFLMFWQLGELLVAQMIVERASSAAGRAAVVVIPDDPAFYDGQLNGSFDGARKREIRFAAGMMLAASPHLSENFTVDVQNVPTAEDQVQELAVDVQAEFRCKRLTWVCGVDGRTVLSSTSHHTYHGARYEYEPTDLTNVQSNFNTSSPGCADTETPNAGDKGPNGAGGKGNHGAGGQGNNGAGGQGNGSTRGGGKCKTGTADPDGLCPDKTCADTGKKPAADADPNWPCDPACPTGQTRTATGCKAGTGCPPSGSGQGGGPGGTSSSSSGNGPGCPHTPPPKCSPGQQLDTTTKSCVPTPDAGSCTPALQKAGKCGDAGAPDGGCDGGQSCSPKYERSALCPNGKPFKTTKSDAPGKCCSSDSDAKTCDCNAQIKLNGQNLQGTFKSSNASFPTVDLDFTAMGTNCDADRCKAGADKFDVSNANAYLQNQYRIDQFKSLCDTKGLKSGKYVDKGIEKTGTFKDMVKAAKRLNDAVLESRVISWANATNTYCKLISDHLDDQGNVTPQSLHLDDTLPGLKNAESLVLARWNSVDGEIKNIGTGKLGQATNGYHTEVKVINALQELADSGVTSLKEGGTLNVTGTQSPCNECDKDLKALSGLGIRVHYCFDSLYAGSRAQTDAKAKQVFLQNPSAGTLGSNVAANGCVDYSNGQDGAYTSGGGLKLCAPGGK